jgi:hypothetical protein
MKSLKLLLGAAALLAVTPAHATVFVVDALGNSSSGGSPLSTITLAAGEVFTLTASTSDLWSAGDLPRLSDANGLIVNRIASPTDDSGPMDGTTQITAIFPLWTQDGFTAPFASLVGRVGTEYQLLGTSFTGSFSSAGTLQLFFWDQNSGDNTGTIAANITTEGPAGVPEPATWAMMLLGFGAVGVAVRRRRARAASPKLI